MNIANLMTILRMVLTVFLWFIMRETYFIYVYFITGITDVLDGYLARKLHIESETGAKLDSVADLMLTVFIVSYIYLMDSAVLMDNMLILVVLFIMKIIVIFITYIRFKRIAIVHTLGNKILGVLIFLLPISIYYQTVYFDWIVLITAALVIIDEMLLAIYSKSFNINRKSFIGNK